MSEAIRYLADLSEKRIVIAPSFVELFSTHQRHVLCNHSHLDTNTGRGVEHEIPSTS